MIPLFGLLVAPSLLGVNTCLPHPVALLRSNMTSLSLKSELLAWGW